MMMLKRRPTRRELYERILGIDAARGEAAKRIDRAVDKLFRDYFARVKAEVARPRKLKTGEAATGESTVRMMGQLDAILVDAGFEDLLQKHVAQFDELQAAALEYYTAFGVKNPSLAGIDSKALDAYIRFSEGELRKIVTTKAIGAVSQALLSVNFAGADRDAVYEQVAQVEEGLSTFQVDVMVNDAFASYQRAVLVESADSVNLEIFVYIGPDDEITSEQCEHMLHVSDHGVDGMLYKDEITPDLHPKLAKYGRNPLIGGGHPNCRHHWSPVTADYAESVGFELRRKAA